jgi:hypothetical protein
MKKQQTKNKNIKRTDPIFLKCTKGKGIKITPMFVHHDNSDDELYYKVELQKRDDETGIWNIFDGNEKWNLHENEISQLFDFITATTELRTKETISLLGSEKEQVDAIQSLLKDDKLSNLLKNDLLKEEDLNTLKSTIKLSELEKAITELENLLLNSDTEKDFENWCKKNIWVFGNYYVASDDIHQISNAERVDLLVKNVLNCYRDIIEFKKPSLKVLEFDSSHQNYYFSNEVSKAISQVINYSDIFTQVALDGLHKHQEIKAFYPKSIIVVGRSNSFNEDQIKALRALNGRLNNIEVKTYDDLLMQAKNLIGCFISNTDNVVAQNSNFDDLPF